MLGQFHSARGFRTNNVPASPGSNYGTNVQSGAGAHTLSASFIEIEDSLPHAIRKIRIIISETSTSVTQTDVLVNLYIGTAGNEKLWIPNLIGGWSAASGLGSVVPKIYEFPLYLPQGTRISGKSQSINASDEVRVALDYSDGWNETGWTGTGVECLGAVPASSQGTTVVAGTAAPGTWTDMGTSTLPYGHVTMMLQGTMTNTAMGANFLHGDIGSGSSAIASDFLFITNTAECMSQGWIGGVYTLIPAGTLVQVRTETSGSITDYDCCVYGVF
jgi:hypothetical protein